MFRNREIRKKEKEMQKIRPDMDIGKNIQKLRKEAHLTQDQVIAKMHLMGLEISKSTYAKLETNRMNIRVSELVALKIIFQVDYNAFFQNIS
jgi:transcriptional regulator with XRE-family HTH domain